MDRASRASLEFKGTQNQNLLVLILVAVILVLLIAGVWQLVRRRWRYGALCLAASVGPIALVPLLTIAAIAAYLRGDGRTARAPLVAAIALTVATVVAFFFIIGAADPDVPWWRAGAFWLGVLGLWVPMAIGVFYAAVFAHLGMRRVSTLMVLRCLAILALLLVLFKPAVSIAPDITSFKPYLPILVDRSGSMSIAPADLPGVKSRYQQALQMLGIEREKLHRYFRVEWYHFGREIDTAETLDAMKRLVPDGEGTTSTDIAGGIRRAAEHYSADQLPGLLLLSDGVHNASSLDKLHLTAMEAGMPIFAVGLGSKADEAAGGKNIRLAEMNVPAEAIKNNVTSIKVRVRMNGFAGDPGELRLTEEGTDEPVAVERLWTDKPFDTVTIDLKWTPKSVGVGGEDSNVSSAVRKLWLSVPVKEGESVKADNKTEVHVLVTEPRVRVLYVEGKMRPEYQRIKRVFDTDPNVQFVGLIRITGNRFWSYGRIDGKKLTNLPTTDADFQNLDVLILGSLERSYLLSGGAEARGRLKRIYDWVNDGGGLLMLGGEESFGPGGYANTDIEKVLPVIVGGRKQPQETTAFVPQLTSLGEKHPVFEGITGFFPGPGGRRPQASLPKLPELLGCVTVEKVKDTAALLAVHPSRTNAAGPLVVLAVQQFGAGRTMAFTADTTWQWYLPLRAMGADSPYERFWGQLVRWLAKVDTKSKESKPSVMLRLGHSYIQVGQTVNITARVQDEKGRAVPTGQATCSITPIGQAGDPESLPLTPQAGGKLFSGKYRPGKEGQYLVKVVATDSAGRALGEDELKLQVAPYSAEMARVALDEQALRDLATRTRGLYADIPGLPEVIDQIVERQKRLAGPIPQPKIYPLYHFTLLFLLFVVLLSVEWIIRRAWQLH